MLRVTTIAETSALTALMLSISGCIIWPNYCVERSGVKSRVVDADTGKPIKGATIHDDRDQKRVCTSDESGSFKLKPTYHWHGGYWLAGISLKILPLTHDVIVPSFAINIIAPGYETAEFAIERMDSWPGRVISPDHSLEAEFDGTYFSISQLTLKRTRPTTTQPTTASVPTS